MGRTYYFHLDENQSPTHYNLVRFLRAQGFRYTRLKWRAQFTDNNLQFAHKATEQLEFKHYFAELTKQYCPQFVPITYCINDQNWPQRLNQLAKAHYFKEGQLYDQLPGVAWILKPALLNNGKSITLFQRLSELELHFLNPHRLGGEHVLQEYLSPHLLRDNRKYSIRLFLILTNYDGAFLYPKGYFNVAVHPYKATDFKHLGSHLTNEHLQSEESNVIQIPSDRFPFFADLYPKIKKMMQILLEGLRKSHPGAFQCSKQRALAFFGVDFMVDDSGRLWLLETNHGPCFPISENHVLQSHLYHEFWQAVIRSFILPIAHQQSLSSIKYDPFESLL